MNVVVLVPTRGRPHAAVECYQAFEATVTEEDSKILFVIDNDDPGLPAYVNSGLPCLIQAKPGNMVKALNLAAENVLENVRPDYLGFIGDDHRFRTKGWDRYFREVLEDRAGGLVYGNDLFWPKGEIPTQIVMSSWIVRALGWMGLPTCRHLYIDNAWRVIGEALGRLVYMPDVVVEHMHPAAGKAVWDEGHLRVNTEEMYSHDKAAFEAWQSKPDVDRVLAAAGRYD